MTAFTPETVQRMCTDKMIAVHSRREAKAKARVVSRKYGASYKPYRCPVCGLFHLTTSRPAEVPHD
jgi:hypothetical protein